MNFRRSKFSSDKHPKVTILVLHYQMLIKWCSMLWITTCWKNVKQNPKLKWYIRIMLPAFFPKYWVLMWTLWQLQKPHEVNHIQVASSLSNPCNLSQLYSNHVPVFGISLLLLLSSNALLLLWPMASPWIF